MMAKRRRSHCLLLDWAVDCGNPQPESLTGRPLWTEAYALLPNIPWWSTYRVLVAVIIVESNESFAVVEDKLHQLGYPSRVARKDLWSKPRAALGAPDPVSGCIEVVYCQGLPRAVVGRGIQSEVLLDYVTGPAFSQPPPVALVIDGSGHVEAFKREGDQFHMVSTAPSWEKTLSEPYGLVSKDQAVRVIQEIAESNQKWLQDARSRRVVGVLPRIFPEGTVVLYELLQNAADSGASEVEFSLEADSLLFMHDGFPFTENDVEAISFVNSSTKPLDTIGFMGIGFKSAYEISDRPEIHSPPYCFRFDRNQEGGELLPAPIGCVHGAFRSHSTLFKFPIKEQARGLITDELERFDGRPLLYIDADLRRITTPSRDFHLRQLQQVGEFKTKKVSDSVAGTETEYAVFNKELEPSTAALQEFADDRNLDPSQIEGQKQRVSTAISLANGIPDSEHSGRLQVYLPTDVRLPVAFDVQGNFLVGASRKELRHAAGPWNREHFQTLPLLVADVLEWAKTQAFSTAGWAAWYDLIPDWQELEERIGLSSADGERDTVEGNLRSIFASELANRKLIPAVDSQGSLVFVAPEDATNVGGSLHTVLPVSDLASLSGSTVISPDLSEKAKDRLGDYVKRFGPVQFMESLEDSAWVDHVGAFTEGIASRQGRQQLAKILAYLEHNWLGRDHLGNRDKWTVVLTQDGKLRAAAEKNARRVHTLPDVDISFPIDELVNHYDVVHQGFRRELNRPGEMNLDPSITRDAVRMLERVAPTLNPGRIASDVILPLFEDDRWKEVSDERILRYTRFLMQHFRETGAAVRKSNFKVKVRGPSRQYLQPSQTYFGREYSLDGERLDRLCTGAEGVTFLSGDYLQQAGGAEDDWVEFFSKISVTALPRIRTSTQYIPERDLENLKKSTGEPGRTYIHLRASPIKDIRTRHYAIDDYVLDAPILKAVQKLMVVKPPGWKDRLADFAIILEDGWGQYEDKLRKDLRFARYGSPDLLRRRVTAPTTFARFLRDEPWLPVADSFHISRRPCELVLNTEENRNLADKEAPLSYCTFQNSDLTSFLEIKEHPPETTPLLRLQYAVNRQEDNQDVFDDLYADLARSSDLDTDALRAEFLNQRLIFVPNRDPSFITSKEVVYASRTSLAPRMAAIKDTYPDLEEFFTKALGIPTTENMEHFVEFLRDYVWKSRPAISDNLRSAVESCYRRFLYHLNETQEDVREEALDLLKEQLGSPALVFCGPLGWVDTTKTEVLYPDTAAYEGLLSGRPGIAIESHLKRLAQPLSEIRTTLEALNVKPMSEAVRRVPEISGSRTHPQSVEYGERLSLLVRKAVAIVEREQDKTESTSRNINLFLQEWREKSESLLGSVHFFESPPINVRDELVAGGTTLREAEWGAYVLSGTNHLRIYISADILDVFDSIADQLRDILRLSLLPAGLRDDVASLIQSNLARLDSQRFGDHLNQRLREKGFPVEEDEELRRISKSAIQPIESELQNSSVEHMQEDESGTEGRQHSTPDNGTASSESKNRQKQTTHKPRTRDDILGALPDFDESSFGSDSVVDLSGTSEWQTITQQSDLRQGSGGGSGGGGNFRDVQAYREAYGARGEQWVVEQERRALRAAGRNDLAESVTHRSKEHEGSPWDIESFEKSCPYRPIYIEVKSTSDTDNLEVDMSIEQVSAALRSTRSYYIYRVMNVHTDKPSVYIYDFKKVSKEIRYSATNVSVLLPRPQSPKQ